MDNLHSNIKRFGFRLRWRDGWVLTQQTLWVVCIFATIIQVIGRFIPIINLTFWTTIPFLIWFLFIAGITLFKPLPPIQTAIRVDIELGLKERLSTALALELHDVSFPMDLVTAQRQDAIKTAQAIDLSLIRFIWLRKPTIAATLLVATLIILLTVPNPMDLILAQNAAVAQAAEAQAEKIEQLRQEIEAQEELSPEQRQELLRQLAELSQALRANPGDLEQALADLSQVERALQTKLDLNAAAREANLESLASRLSALTDQKNETNRLEAAIQALESLSEGIEQMDPTQRQELAQSFAQMAARSMQNGDAQLAQAMSAMSQAIQSGDSEAVKQAAQAASTAMAQTQKQLTDQAALQRALSQVKASSQAMAQAGQSLANSQRGSQGQSPGMGQSQTPGQPGGGGSQANTLPPGTSQGQAGAPQGPADQDPIENTSGTQVNVPRQPSQGNGDLLFIPGQDTGVGDSQASAGNTPLPGSTSPSLVPYSQAYYHYLEAINQAMAQIFIPAALESYIREYFSQLEP